MSRSSTDCSPCRCSSVSCSTCVVGAWWADPLAGFVIVFYGLKEANAIFRPTAARDIGLGDGVGDQGRAGYRSAASN